MEEGNFEVADQKKNLWQVSCSWTVRVIRITRGKLDVRAKIFRTQTSARARSALVKDNCSRKLLAKYDSRDERHTVYNQVLWRRLWNRPGPGAP